MKVWNSTIERHTELRAETPLRKVNGARRRRLYRKNFGEYSDLIRQMPCTVCDRSPAEPHHVRSRGAGGDKSDLVPLDRRCHSLLHLMGRQSFEARFRVDLAAEAAELWEQHGDG